MPTGGFNPREVFAIAREMEEEGLAFYKAVARQVGDPDAKALFLKLASDELQHVRDIERLEEHGEEYFPTEEDSLVAQYIQGIVDTKVFPPVSEVPEIAGSTRGLTEAIGFGISAEERAIEFYTKAKSEARTEEAVDAFSRLLEQEEEHLALLAELRKRLATEPPSEE